jgi:glycosyltransferase involved in cell wall biosynthesis
VSIRILFLAPQPFFRQRGTPIAELAALRVLVKRGYEVDVLTYGEGEPVDIPGCTIHRIPRMGSGRVRPGFSLGKLVRDAVMVVHGWGMVRRRRYDLVHAVEEGVFMAMLMKARFGVPYVYDMDSSLSEQLVEQLPGLRFLTGLFDRVEAWAIRHAAAVLVVCRALEDRVRAYEPSALVGRVEDAAFVSSAVAEERLSDHVPEGAPVVLYVGNLMPYQGVELLVEAFRHALGEVPDSHLVIIGGSDPRREVLRSAIRKSGLAGRVHLIGPRPLDHLPWYLGQATVLASPRTAGTNTPMKLYSYLASGVPVLATRLSTHTQVVDDRTAVLRAPEPRAMGEGLVALLTDPELRDRIGSAARALAEEEYTHAAFERKLGHFYDQVEPILNGRGGGAGPGPGSTVASGGEGP